MIYTIYIWADNFWHCIYLYAGHDDDQINKCYQIAKMIQMHYHTKLVRTFDYITDTEIKYRISDY